MEKAIIGEGGWKWAYNGVGTDLITAKENGFKAGYFDLARDLPDLDDPTRKLIQSCPDIASTAIAALSRVEELEAILARHKELGIGENV